MILNPASRKKRIFAASVDIVIVVVVYFFVVVMFGNKQEDASGHVKFVLSGLPSFFLFLCIWSYFVIPEIISGQTLSKSLFDIKVVSLNGNDIDLKQSFLRHLCDLIDFAPFAFIVFIIVTNNNDKKQRVGDMLAKTIVIEEQK
jgi:uncharacterized RDD family membrane protein YckC